MDDRTIQRLQNPPLTLMRSRDNGNGGIEFADPACSFGWAAPDTAQGFGDSQAVSTMLIGGRGSQSLTPINNPGYTVG